MDEWLIYTVITLYTEACTVVKTFDVKVGLHEGSVLSPLSSELLKADDLVLMAPTMEQLGERVAQWRSSLLDKGLKVNAGKSKVMLDSSGGKMIVNSGKSSCGVCAKGM